MGILPWTNEQLARFELAIGRLDWYLPLFHLEKSLWWRSSVGAKSHPTSAGGQHFTPIFGSHFTGMLDGPTPPMMVWLVWERKLSLVRSFSSRIRLFRISVQRISSFSLSPFGLFLVLSLLSSGSPLSVFPLRLLSFRNKHFASFLSAGVFPTNQLCYDHWTNLVDEHGLCAANVAACRAFDKLTPSISNRICPVDTRAIQPVGFPFPLPILTSVGFPVIGRSARTLTHILPFLRNCPLIARWNCPIVARRAASMARYERRPAL